MSCYSFLKAPHGIYLDVVGGACVSVRTDKMIPTIGIEAGVFARHCGANFWCHKGYLLKWVVLWGTRYPVPGGSARPLLPIR